ncbi:MAG: hypothetical protein ISR77_28980 [Pirellulaceae bacterium]|nr:hypothetical protein [Pirellulaceae bacterium]
MFTSQNENPYASPLTDNVLPDKPELASLQASPCPRCGSNDEKPVPYSPLMGRHGPRAVDHVRCSACGTQYNGETGREITSRLWRHLLPVLLAGILGLLYIALGFLLSLP